MDTQPAGPPAGALPVTVVTADQLVAINMRRWRIAAGLTQEELGKLLGWTPAIVSAAERSADPARDRRRFDARDLVLIATSLGVPLIALFLPPSDDGLKARYLIAPAAGGELEMGEYLDTVVMHDSGERTEAMTGYIAALAAGARQYLDPEWAELFSRWLEVDSPRQRNQLAAEFREQAEEARRALEVLSRMAAMFGTLADKIEVPE